MDRTRVILLVDDVEQVGSIAADYLERRLADVKVVPFLRPQAALDWLKAGNRADLVVSDNHMGEMDGLTFLAACRDAQPEGVRALMTAYLDLVGTPQDLAERGIHALIRKPWEWPDFARFVDGLASMPAEERARRTEGGPIAFPASAWREFADHHAGRTAPRPQAAEPDPEEALHAAARADEPAESTPPARVRRGARPDIGDVECPHCHGRFPILLPQDPPARGSGAKGAPAAGRAAAGPAARGAAAMPPISDEDEARRILAYLRDRPRVASIMKNLEAPPRRKAG